MKSRNVAFSLVELSIVLVILGLLVGGVLSGQSLIRAAELRSVTTQYNQYVAAVNTFKDKYFAIPGDMANATTFWGAADGSTGTTAACKTIAETGTATCNGNGNGSIDFSLYSELYLFWKHMANAGLIEGNYNGIGDPSTGFGATAKNSPTGKFQNSLWFAANLDGFALSTVTFAGTYGNSLEFGGMYPDQDPFLNILKPEEAWNLDTKVDDGKPATGHLVIRDNAGSLTLCTDTNDPTNLAANYLLSNKSPGCTIIVRNTF